MASLEELMRKNKKSASPTGMVTEEVTPLAELSAQAGLQAQPTTAIGAGLLGATPKQQDMAAAQQTVQAAQQQAAQPQTLAQAMSVTKEIPLDPTMGENKVRAKQLISNAQQIQNVFGQKTAEQALGQFNIEASQGPTVAAKSPEEYAASIGKTKESMSETDWANYLNLLNSDVGGQFSSKFQGNVKAFGLLTDQEKNQLTDIINQLDQNTLQSLGIDKNKLADISVEQAEKALQSYLKTTEIDDEVAKARQIVNDPNSPLAVRQQAYETLRQYSQTAIIATDEELSSVIQDLEDLDRLKVTVNGKELDLSYAELANNPLVQTELDSFATALMGADKSLHAGLLQEAINKNPALKPLLNSVANNYTAWKASLDAEKAARQSTLDTKVKPVLDKYNAAKTDFGEDVLKEAGVTPGTLPKYDEALAKAASIDKDFTKSFSVGYLKGDQKAKDSLTRWKDITDKTLNYGSSEALVTQFFKLNPDEFNKLSPSELKELGLDNNKDGKIDDIQELRRKMFNRDNFFKMDLSQYKSRKTRSEEAINSANDFRNRVGLGDSEDNLVNRIISDNPIENIKNVTNAITELRSYRHKTHDNGFYVLTIDENNKIDSVLTKSYQKIGEAKDRARQEIQSLSDEIGLKEINIDNFIAKLKQKALEDKTNYNAQIAASSAAMPMLSLNTEKLRNEVQNQINKIHRLLQLNNFITTEIPGAPVKSSAKNTLTSITLENSSKLKQLKERLDQVYQEANEEDRRRLAEQQRIQEEERKRKEEEEKRKKDQEDLARLIFFNQVSTERLPTVQDFNKGLDKAKKGKWPF